MKRNMITEVRSSTNRPDIGLHVVHTEPIEAMQSLLRIVAALSMRLAADERILVFCSGTTDVDDFALRAKCAVYRDNLSGFGNNKGYNLYQWDEGLEKVMVCTAAFNQGMATPHVRYMVIFRPTLGLVLNNKMLGLVGRDGKESHVFFLVDEARGSFRLPPNDQCATELEDVVYGKRCRRLTNMLCMDGDYLAVRCIDEPPGIHCDVCDPNSVMQRLAVEAIKCPLRPPKVPVFTVPPVTVHGSALQGPTHAPKDLFMGFVKASSMVPRDIMVCHQCHIIMQFIDQRHSYPHQHMQQPSPAMLCTRISMHLQLYQERRMLYKPFPQIVASRLRDHARLVMMRYKMSSPVLILRRHRQ
jgi:hypothetical protein